MKIVQVALQCFPAMRGQTRLIRIRTLHALERGCAGDRELMQIPLELWIAGESHSAGEAHNRCGVGLQSFGHEPNAHEYEFPGMFLHGPNDLLPALVEL